MRTTPRTDTSTRILDVAEQLVQQHGYNGFSYADVAARVRIRKASLHHHFSTKAELGGSLVERYHGKFFEALERIGRTDGPARLKLEAYTGLYRAVLKQGRMCLCGMLAADASTLPAAMKRKVTRFFEENEAWLAALLEAGRRDGSLTVSGTARTAAQQLVCALEGALLVARSHGGVKMFDGVVATLLRELSPGR